MNEGTTVNRETRLADLLETDVCSRCGGTGRYSWNQRDADKCYGCGGSGTTYTKRGAAALAFYREIMSVERRFVQPGDKFFDSHHGWCRVESVEDNRVAQKGGAIFAPGDPRAADLIDWGATWRSHGDSDITVHDGLNIKTNKVGFNGFAADGTVQTALAADMRVPVLATVAAFQDSLTKAGKPRKNGRKV